MNGVPYISSAKLTSKCLMEGRGLGTVICMGWFFNNAGSHLAVGRHDGSIQLYIVDMENLTEKPRLKFTYVSFIPFKLQKTFLTLPVLLKQYLQKKIHPVFRQTQN